MILNNETAEKVANLFKIPVNTVEYNGSRGNEICFLIGSKDKEFNWVNGIAAYINEEFKVLRVERIKLSIGRYTRNYPIRKQIVPIYSNIKN